MNEVETKIDSLLIKIKPMLNLNDKTIFYMRNGFMSDIKSFAVFIDTISHDSKNLPPIRGEINDVVKAAIEEYGDIPPHLYILRGNANKEEEPKSAIPDFIAALSIGREGNDGAIILRS